MLTHTFSDVLHDKSDIDVYVYDRANQEAFLGHIKVPTDCANEQSRQGGWYTLESREPTEESVSGEIHLEFEYMKSNKKHYGVEDFQVLRLIGKGIGSLLFQCGVENARG